jgi:S-adenosylmethionine decarboxylase
MQGLHLTADLHGCQCDATWLTDAAATGTWCVSAVENAGLSPVAKLFHSFAGVGTPACGFTATVLLAESHLCLHTWPEQQAVTLDVYVCNFGGDHSAKAQALMASLIGLFKPRYTDQHALQRGLAPAPLAALACDAGPPPDWTQATNAAHTGGPA